MQNETNPAPDTSGAEATEAESPAATESPTANPVCPDCGEEHPVDLPENLSAMLSSFAGRTRIEAFTGHPVEIAADIIGQLRLSPRDLVTLASALLCTVVERSHDDWGTRGNPFGHIDYNMNAPGNNPFKVGIACLSVVDSWGDNGFNPPPADSVAH